MLVEKILVFEFHNFVCQKFNVEKFSLQGFSIFFNGGIGFLGWAWVGRDKILVGWGKHPAVVDQRPACVSALCVIEIFGLVLLERVLLPTAADL